jgi:diguanylate cyclase
MWQALTCLPEQHDLSYVLAATLVCVLGSLLSMRLLARVRRNTGMRRLHLLFLAGFFGHARLQRPGGARL